MVIKMDGQALTSIVMALVLDSKAFLCEHGGHSAVNEVNLQTLTQAGETDTGLPVHFTFW